MKIVYKWILSIILLIGIASGSYFWALGMIESNYNYGSLLKNNPPAAGDPLGDPATTRVVVVLIDALRYDTSLDSEVMPTLSNLRQIGASALMHSQPPSFSEPGYSTLLTGAWPEINDGPAFNIDYEEIPVFTQDNVFSAAHRAGFTTAISGYYWFEKLVPQSEIDLSFYTPGEDSAADQDVMDAALPWLTDHQADFILIHLDQVDYAGHHEGGAKSENWNAAAKRCDDMLVEILATLDLEKDTLVVLSDHGQIDAGGHGGQDPIVLLEPFVIAGAGVNPGTYTDIQMVDVAPTLAALMGASLPASTQGVVHTEMLTLTDSVLNALPQSVQKQQTSLLTAFIHSIGADTEKIQIPQNDNVSAYQQIITSLIEQKTFTERVLRAIPAALILGTICVLLYHNRKNGALLWVISGVIFQILFVLKYAIIDGKTFSLSSIISEMNLILTVGITSAVIALLLWLFNSFMKKTFTLPPSIAGLRTLYFGLTLVFIIMIPVFVSFVLNGAVVTWTLPDYLTSFLALIGLIQALLVSLLTLMLAGLSALLAKIPQKS